MTALPRLTSAQANALRLSARDGLRWDGARWVWGNACVGVPSFGNATINALGRHDCLTIGWDAMHPTATGRAWLAANPDGKA